LLFTFAITNKKMSAQPSAQVPAVIPPVPSARAPSLAEDKSKQKKFHGFIAGVFSGVTKLVVGHPFGKKKPSTLLEYCSL
jgi:hypothetical protein